MSHTTGITSARGPPPVYQDGETPIHTITRRPFAGPQRRVRRSSVTILGTPCMNYIEERIASENHKQPFFPN